MSEQTYTAQVTEGIRVKSCSWERRHYIKTWHRGHLLVFGRVFISDMCVCVSTGACTYVSVPQLFVSYWLMVVLCLFSGSINVLFFYLKMVKNHHSEKDGSEKRNAFMPVRSHFLYTRRHTRTQCRVQPRLVMLERPPGGATMRWPDRRGMLSSICAPGDIITIIY